MNVRLQSSADETGLRNPTRRAAASVSVPAVTVAKASEAMNSAATNDNAEKRHDYEHGAGKFVEGAYTEKLIIAKEIKAILTHLIKDNRFNPDKDKIIDIGCGPALLMLPLLSRGYHVDGFDPSNEMMAKAKKLLKEAKFDKPVVESVKLTRHMKSLRKEAYSVGMLNFVTQTSETKADLKTLFQQAHGLIKDGGTLIVTGAHPDYLHIPHANCEYDVKDSSQMVDGQLYTGRIVNSIGGAVYRLDGDYFWGLRTMQDVAESAGFVHEETGRIHDEDSLTRDASGAAYFRMTLRRSAVPALTA